MHREGRQGSASSSTFSFRCSSRKDWISESMSQQTRINSYKDFVKIFGGKSGGVRGQKDRWISNNLGWWLIILMMLTAQAKCYGKHVTGQNVMGKD